MSINDRYEKVFIRKGYVRYILPAMLAMIFGQLSPLVDSICVSSKLGDAALSSFSTVSPVYYFFNIIGVLGGMGGGIGIAKASGSGDHKRAGRLFTLSLILTTAITIICSIICLIFIDPLLKLLFATPENFGYAKEYLTVLLMGMVFYVLNFAIEYILTDDNNPNLAMAGGIVTGVVNMIVDYAGIYIFHQGIWVTAFGTVFGAFCGLLVSLLHMRKPDRLCRFVFDGLRIDKDTVAELVKPGTPEGLQYVLITLQLLIGNYVLSDNLGTSGLGNAAVIENLELIATIVIAGVSEAVMPLAASYFGERNKHGLGLVKRFAFVIGSLTLFPLVLSLLIYPEWLMMFFFVDDPVMKATLPRSIRIMATSQMILLLDAVFVSYLSSTEEENKANISYVIMSVVQISLTYALSAISPQNAPWYASLLGGLSAFIYFVFICRIFTGRAGDHVGSSLYVGGGHASEDSVHACVEQARQFLDQDEYDAVCQKIAEPFIHSKACDRHLLYSFCVISHDGVEGGGPDDGGYDSNVPGKAGSDNVGSVDIVPDSAEPGDVVSDKAVILRYDAKEDIVEECFEDCIYSEFNFARRIMLSFGNSTEEEE